MYITLYTRYGFTPLSIWSGSYEQGSDFSSRQSTTLKIFNGHAYVYHMPSSLLQVGLIEPIRNASTVFVGSHSKVYSYDFTT